MQRTLKDTYQGLDDGVICCVHVCVEWKRAFAVAVESSVALRRNDPILNKQRASIIYDTCWAFVVSPYSLDKNALFFVLLSLNVTHKCFVISEVVLSYLPAQVSKAYIKFMLLAGLLLFACVVIWKNKNSSLLNITDTNGCLYLFVWLLLKSFRTNAPDKHISSPQTQTFESTWIHPRAMLITNKLEIFPVNVKLLQNNGCFNLGLQLFSFPHQCVRCVMYLHNRQIIHEGCNNPQTFIGPLMIP